MTKLFSYSFSLTTPSPPKPELNEYSYSEFVLGLPEHWKQVPTATDNTLNFHSERLGCTITISADYYEIPDAKARGIAEQCLSSRLSALEQVGPGQVQVFQRTVKQHSGGIGLELSLVAEMPDGHVYLYLGYVTTRKVLNFTLVCPPGRQAAAALYNETVPNFRPRLP